jgi:uncharacterized integral membrane protein
VEDRGTATGAQPPSEGPRGDHGRQARVVITGIAVVLLIWFAVANFQHVKIHFWLTTSGAPLIVVIVISAFLGAAASGLWSRRRRRRRAGGPGD